MTREEFRDALVELGWTQKFLAERLGVDLSTVNRWATHDHPGVSTYASAYLELALGLHRLHAEMIAK
jgi:transcriptional regulator with XRE-family HTH domain